MKIHLDEICTCQSTEHPDIGTDASRCNALTKDTAMVFFVHSDWSYKLVTELQSEGITTWCMQDERDKHFIHQFNQLCVNPDLRDKTISIKFDYSSESSVICEPFLGPLFHMPSNAIALVKHIRSKLGANSVDFPTEICDQQTKPLITAINEVFDYQGQIKQWLDDKLSTVKHSISSDDSGISLTPNKKLHEFSFLSPSAESVYTCLKNDTTNDLGCVAEIRRNSCTRSFYPPDTSDDEASVGTSLLENQLHGINSRSSTTRHN